MVEMCTSCLPNSMHIQSHTHTHIIRNLRKSRDTKNQTHFTGEPSTFFLFSGHLYGGHHFFVGPCSEPYRVGFSWHPHGMAAMELSGNSTSCLGFGMAGSSAWIPAGWWNIPGWNGWCGGTPHFRKSLYNILYHTIPYYTNKLWM